MLCYAMLCYAMLCHVMSCHVMFCCFVMSYHMSCHFVLCHVILHADNRLCFKKPSVTFLINDFSAIQIDFLLEKYLNEENTFMLYSLEIVDDNKHRKRE